MAINLTLLHCLGDPLSLLLLHLYMPPHTLMPSNTTLLVILQIQNNKIAYNLQKLVNSGVSTIQIWFHFAYDQVLNGWPKLND